MGSSVPALDRDDRWLGVGHSREPDSATAGFQAADEAIQGSEPKLLIVFCSEQHDQGALLGAIGEASGEVPLIGCSTAGEISSSGPGDASVVVTALGGPGFHAITAGASFEEHGMRGAAASVAETAGRLPSDRERLLILLTDGLAGDQQEVVRGAYGIVGAGVPLVGGCAGDGLRMRSTAQLLGRKAMKKSVVGAAVSSTAPFGIGVRHGWRKVGAPMLVTSSRGNLVRALDDRPALDAYLERLDAPAEVGRDSEAFTRFALTHPLGLDRRSGEEQVRFISGANFEDRSLSCIAEVPQGGLAWLMEGDERSVLEATESACRDAIAPLNGDGPLGLLAFDCIARRGVLGNEGIGEEVDLVSHHAGGAPVAGFYTYGEIARTRGVTGFHNQTLVVLAVG